MTTIRVSMAVPLEGADPLWNTRLWLVANADVVARKVYPESERVGRWAFTVEEEPRDCKITQAHQHFEAKAPGDSGYVGATEVQSGEIRAMLYTPRGHGVRFRSWLARRLVDWFGEVPFSWPLGWLRIYASYFDSGNSRVLCPVCEEWEPMDQPAH